MYTLIGTAKLNGIDPETYLSHVLARIADHPINRIDELLLGTEYAPQIGTRLRVSTAASVRNCQLRTLSLANITDREWVKTLSTEIN
jgi:hypothetical protein